MPGLYASSAYGSRFANPRAGGGLLDYGPATARYPQNAGLAASVEGLRQRNIANAQRPVYPYSPSPGDPNLSGAGAYALHLQDGGGLMWNYQAQQNYASTGYMPNRTVGGRFGLGAHAPSGPDNPYTGIRLSSQQVLAQASGNQYAPMGLAAMGNPGGRYYGGAIPGMVGGRQAWTSGPEQYASAGSLPSGRYIGGIRPGEPGFQGLAAVSENAERYTDAPGYVPATRASMTAAASGLLGSASPAAAKSGAAIDPATRALGLRAYRQGIYQQRQQNRIDAAQVQMEMMNPEYGLAMAGLRQQAQARQGVLDYQNRTLTQQGEIAREGLASKERGATADREQRMALAKLQSEQAAFQRLHELALQTGNHEAAAKIAAAHSANALKLAEIQGQTQRDIAKETHGYQRDEIQLKREALAQQRADSLRQQASEAYQSGDVARGQQLEQQATAAMAGITGLAGAATPPVQPAPGQSPQVVGLGTAGPGGLLPKQSWAQLPHAARAALIGNSPTDMLKNLRMSMPGLSQDEADRMVQDAYPGTTATSYNPSGYGLSDYVGGVTGLENIPRSIAWWSGRGPKPPSLWDGGPPIPVLPGIGAWQTRAGY